MNLGNLAGVLQQYVGASPDAAPDDVHEHFDEVAQTAPQETVAQGISQAFRSDQTPPFPAMVSQLYGQSNGEQRAGLLNNLLSSVGPGALSSILGGGALSGLAGLLGGGQRQITPQEADRVPPEAVQQLATHAEKQNSSVIDSVSSFYSQHPGLVKTLGGAALTIAMAKMAQRQFPGRG